MSLVPNRYYDELMDKPSLTPGRCVICGETHGVTGHHPASRAQGGEDGPTLDLCFKHHEAAESERLHFRYTDRWEYRELAVPTKYEAVLQMTGWKAVPCTMSWDEACGWFYQQPAKVQTNVMGEACRRCGQCCRQQDPVDYGCEWLHVVICERSAG